MKPPKGQRESASADRVSRKAVKRTPMEQACRNGYVKPQDSGAGGDHFTVGSGVDLSSSARHTLRDIAENYYIRTCGMLKVHSGTRTAHQQAQAMWNNMYYSRNRQVHYRNTDAFDEIHEAYLEGRRAGANERAIVEAMTRVIEEQVRNGVYISRHLEGTAVDILPNTNPPLHPHVLEEVVTELLSSGHCIPEEDHFHIQF